jgi:hypothetical protein
MMLYNEAVAELNRATAAFNNFVKHRNNQFIPAGTDAEIKALLDPVSLHISAAMQKISGIGKVVPNYQYDPATLNNKLISLMQRVQEQQEFLKKYFAASEADKKKLFYK